LNDVFFLFVILDWRHHAGPVRDPFWLGSLHFESL
jgi:hypothetical protein